MPMWFHILAAVLVAIPRVLGVKHEAYQAVAHLYVGGVFTAWYFTKNQFWLIVGVMLSILEVICFLVQR